METQLRSFVSSVNLAKTDSLSDTDGGTIFKKQLFTFGTWINPNWWWDDVLTMDLTPAFAQEFIDNFSKNTLGSKVAVPLNHTGDVSANTGEVLSLEMDGEGLNGTLKIVDPEAVQKIRDGRIFDVSIGFDWDYVSQKDGSHHGAVLFHVALVTEPYINNMSGFVETELSKRHDAYAKKVGFGAQRESVIMFSKDRVKGLQEMKFAKVKNDKAYDVEIKYTETDGTEVTKIVTTGAELEVPEYVETSVKEQIAEAADPTTETEEEKTAREAAEKEAVEKKAADDEAARKAAEDKTGEEETELSKANARIADLESEKTYNELLSKGKITPAQKEMFMSLAKQTQVSLSKPLKINGTELAKDSKPSMISLMSAIFSAGPSYVKLGEQGKDKVEGAASKLTPEEEAEVKAAGFSVEKFNNQLAKGNITMNDIREKK